MYQVTVKDRESHHDEVSDFAILLLSSRLLTVLGWKSLTSITILENVTRIGDWTFYECSSLISMKYQKV